VALKKRTGRETSALHWPCGGVNSMALPTRLSRTWESHPPSPLPVQGLASSLALSAAIGFDCRHDLVHDVARRLWSSYRMRLAPSFLENAHTACKPAALTRPSTCATRFGIRSRLGE
jgi:hypothetical protein